MGIGDTVDYLKTPRLTGTTINWRPRQELNLRRTV